MTRDQRELAIKALTKEYPKAFFATGNRRKPLKHGIEKDIEVDLAKNEDSELLDYDITETCDWYRSHVGYQSNCTAGTDRIDLNGQPTGKVTENEAREAAEEAQEIFAKIESRKRQFGPQTQTSPVSWAPSSLSVNANLNNLEMLAEIERQIPVVRSIIADDPDDMLRRELARQAMRLMSDELQTMIARLDQKASANSGSNHS
jgi:hypothetical protein